MSTPLVCLAYKSRAADCAVDERTLTDILTVAQALNVDNDITGALAYGDGHFIQVLEGPAASVLSTMDRIRADGRHHVLSVIGPSPISYRTFPDWCMARLSQEPNLRPILSLLLDDWEIYAARASSLLARALGEQPDASPTTAMQGLFGRSG